MQMMASLCTSSKRKDSEPGTKSLLSNAEMMAHHPTDPVEMRRINFQTPGTCSVQHPCAATRAHTHTHFIFCIIKYPSDCSSSLDNEIFMRLIITFRRDHADKIVKALLLLLLLLLRIITTSMYLAAPDQNGHCPGSTVSA